MAAAITTAARALVGRLLQQVGRRHQQGNATASAPTTPVSWVWEPAASATGVREELLLIGKPWNKAADQVGCAQPDHFLVGVDMGCLVRAA